MPKPSIVTVRARFSAEPSGHGGNRRSHQIRELFEKNGWQYIGSSPGSTATSDVFLDEDSYGIARGTHKASRDTYVAWPHNVEHLVREQFRRRWESSAAKRREMGFFERARHVVTISQYDSWYLALHGIDSTVLPYFPVTTEKLRLIECRNRRVTGEISSYALMLGTYGNPPTAQAFRHAIKAYAAKKRQFRLVIVGHGTEKLRKQVHLPTGVILKGQLSDADLQSEIARARVALVHQTSGTGALTRIAELHVAGVPIIATAIAARGYETLDGIAISDNIYSAFEHAEQDALRVGPDYAPFEKSVLNRSSSLIRLYEQRFASS